MAGDMKTGARVGRPPKPASERKAVNLPVALTVADRARYRAAAEAQGTDLASVAREAWERMAKRAERAEREGTEDPVLRALERAPIDGEPVTDEDRRATREGRSDVERGETMTTSELLAAILREG